MGAARNGSTDPARAVYIGLLTGALRSAVTVALERSDWRPRETDDGSLALRLTERAPSEVSIGSMRTVLVVDATAVGCATGVHAVLLGLVGSVVAMDELVALRSALDATDRGACQLTHALLARAAAVPALGERQTAVLAQRLSGVSVQRVGPELGMSTATVKRIVLELYGLFGVRSHAELVAKALSLGFTIEPARFP